MNSEPSAGQADCRAMFTAEDNRGSTREQLDEGTVEVQVAEKQWRPVASDASRHFSGEGTEKILAGWRVQRRSFAVAGVPTR